MYGVVHGGTDPELRKRSAEFISSLPFQGTAIGGSLGHNHNEMNIVLSALELPPERPTHLLGIADLQGISNSVVHGVDTFDSCLPARLGRHGTLLAHDGNILLRQTKHKHAVSTPLPYTPEYSLSYLHHLHKQHEPLGMTLGTIHNLAFMADFMAEIRQKIKQNLI